MQFSRKKIAASLVAMAVVAAGAFGAFAYFTQAGSGTGSGTVGSPSAIQLSSPTVSPLFPGGADVDVTVAIDNPGSGSQHVDTVSGVVQDNAGCLGSWFEVDDVVANATLAAGGATDVDTVVRMLDSGTNQDVCKGKTMTIDWSSN